MGYASGWDDVLLPGSAYSGTERTCEDRGADGTLLFFLFFLFFFGMEIVVMKVS